MRIQKYRPGTFLHNVHKKLPLSIKHATPRTVIGPDVEGEVEEIGRVLELGLHR